YKYFRKFGIKNKCNVKNNEEKYSIKILKEKKKVEHNNFEFDELLYEKQQKRFLLILMITCVSIFSICLVTYLALYI
ncbi:hypothetical protein, partial [Spiroplasma sp. hyd1]|uniref:hypothetical protein n=1 Tax=Spiroplasma sp. hyd1 TaxID=1609976 RepID=UPI001E37D826